MSLLFKLLSKASPDTVDKYIAQRWVKVLENKDLSLAFVDTNGKAWFEYPDNMGMSVKRMAANMQVAQYLNANMSKELLTECVNDIKTFLAEADMIGAGARLTDLMTLSESIVPFDVLVNMIANDLVREDEDPKDTNDKVHIEKCNYIKSAIENGDSFFFQLTVVKDLSNKFKISKDSWRDLLIEFQEVVQTQKRRSDILHSMNSRT
tara:strand:+ start:3468 stop:4088 length:621 start_codon:yes stop_codon:yes gene_type:complete